MRFRKSVHDSTNQVQQTTTNQRKSEEIWGDRISKEINKIIQITFQNIRGFGTEKDSIQSEAI
jgi:hypothetical protein